MKTLMMWIMGLILPLAALAQSPSPNGWDQASREALHRHVPLVIVFEAEGCGNCEQLRKQVLEPMRVLGDLCDRALVRVQDINASGRVTDFDGLRIRADRFVERYNVFATPTVVIVDHKGLQLTDSIVGYTNAEEYRTLLNSAVKDATSAMRRPIAGL